MMVSGLFQKTTRFGLLILIGLLPFLFACNNAKEGGNKGANTEQKATDAKNSDPITVTTGKTIVKQMPTYIRSTGSLIPEETSNVAPRVAGKVLNVYANVGEYVPQGRVIARLDDKDARLRVTQAEVAVKQSEAAVKQAEARLGLGDNGRFDSNTIPEVRAANANIVQLQTELKQAEVNEKRYRELVESGDVAMIVYEQYRTTRDTAKAKVLNAQEQMKTAINAARQNNQAIKTAQANVDASKTQVFVAKQALEDFVVKAPFSGYVSSRPLAVGEFATSSTPVLTLLRINPIKVQIQIPESDSNYVKMGRGVSLEIEAFKDRKFAGTVSAISPALDATSRSVIVEAQIPNNENLLRTGMFATVKIVRDGVVNGIFAPKASIFNDQATQSYRIFVIKDGVAKLKVAQIGSEEDDMVQILSGVEPDESVATSNLDQLFEGAKVAS